MLTKQKDTEGLIILLDVGVSMSTKINNSSYLQTCLDIVQMIVQRKMFQMSKDELGLILFGTRETANALWNGSSDHYSHVTVVRPLNIVDWNLLEFVQNKIGASNLQGDVIDGVLVASNHYHEDSNELKLFKDKRIIILTDFSSSTEEDGDLGKLCKGLSKHEIRVDVISPFGEFDDEDNDENKGPSDKPMSSKDADSKDFNKPTERKPMTNEQKRVQKALRDICEKTEGAMYSFGEVLTLLSCYQAKSIKSSGTKYLMKIGENFKMPIVSMIRCKENKPDLFKFKKVYAKDESVNIKTDRARFTKDDEQRDLDDKNDVVDAYRYGTDYIPIDDTEALRLKADKCFDVLGFTKSENINRNQFLSESVNQIMPDPASDDGVEEAFVNMVHAMRHEGVYAIVRRVFSARSSPELACLIPYVTDEEVYLLYMSLPFADDVRNFTFENFSTFKKYQPDEKQLELADQLIDSMDLMQDNGSDNESEELYDPHTTFNPYIQRMFQSIAQRAADPQSDLPDFENHITNSLISDIGKKVLKSETLDLLKRCEQAFPTRENVKKVKVDTNAIFNNRAVESQEDEKNDKIDMEAGDLDLDLQDLLVQKRELNKIKSVGTTTPANDFKHLADKIISNETNEESLEGMCDGLFLQLEIVIREIFNESLALLDDEINIEGVKVYQEKAVSCIRALREYCLKLKRSEYFNRYMKTFKVYLTNEARGRLFVDKLKLFWNQQLKGNGLTLISKNESAESEVTSDEANEFIKQLMDDDIENNDVKNNSIGKEDDDVEDLLDLM